MENQLPPTPSREHLNGDFDILFLLIYLGAPSMKVLSHLLPEEECESRNKMYSFNKYLLCIFRVCVGHGKERPCETGWKIKGDWQIRGCAAPVLADGSRRGSD